MSLLLLNTSASSSVSYWDTSSDGERLFWPKRNIHVCRVLFIRQALRLNMAFEELGIQLIHERLGHGTISSVRCFPWKNYSERWVGEGLGGRRGEWKVVEVPVPLAEEPEQKQLRVTKAVLVNGFRWKRVPERVTVGFTHLSPNRVS